MSAQDTRTEIAKVKAALRAVILLADFPDAAKAELILTAEECVDEAMFDELASAEADEQEREAGIYHRERAADIRDFQRRVL